MKNILRNLIMLALILNSLKGICQDEHHEYHGEIVQKTSHPASTVSFIIVENETIIFGEEGFDEIPENRTLIQPIFGFRIFNDKLTFATRPSFEFLSAPHERHEEGGRSVERLGGFGDIGLMSLLTPISRHEGFIWSLGYSATFPTASEEALGSGKFQIGPAASLFYLGEEYGTGFRSVNVGAFIEHWWSYAGDSQREDTSFSSIQYVLMYRLTNTMQIGMEPKITVDWKEERGNKLNFPIGLGIGDLFRVGKIPIQWRVEGQYFLASSQLEGEEFAFLITLEPILSSLFK
ncbi:MAG: hypothetical protein AAFQ94_02735 [Bacteroidota bacterium]